VDNLLRKIIDSMNSMIRVVGLTARCFWFLWEFLFLYFLKCPLRILDSYIWGFKKRPAFDCLRRASEILNLTRWACVLLVVAVRSGLCGYVGPRHGVTLTLDEDIVMFQPVMITSVSCLFSCDFLSPWRLEQHSHWHNWQYSPFIFR